MKFLFATDSFKGSLTCMETAALLDRAAREVFPDCETDSVPVADGGEGSAEAVIRATGGDMVRKNVTGPLWETVTASYGRVNAQACIIEMAQASGLTLIAEDRRDPLLTTTYGTGELIMDALEKGFTDITVAIGGSATNDGGMGCMRALGARFLDENGNELRGCGGDLAHVHTVDVSGFDPRVRNAHFTVMCDVINPLTGANGATYTFGKQKGATPEMLQTLERGMCHYRDAVARTFPSGTDNVPGAGAAGGLGFALAVFCNARMRSGIETVLDLIGFDKRLAGVDLVITGEGRTDFQSVQGKALSGIGKRCAEHHIPVIALSASAGEGAELIYADGIDALFTSVNAPMSLEEAMNKAAPLYYDAAVGLFRTLRAGMRLNGQERP